MVRPLKPGGKNIKVTAYLQAMDFPYTIYPLGDMAITIDYGNRIDPEINREVLSLFHALESNPLHGMIEAVPAYASLTLFFNVVEIKKYCPVGTTAFAWFRKETENWLETGSVTSEEIQNHITIPVCYDDAFAPDLEIVAGSKNLSKEEVISLHTSKTYRVYMLGFLPGFPYMGLVDERIAVPRKEQPAKVEAGSVALAGNQTGIYPFASPGGWQVIGSTPVKMFEPDAEKMTPLKPGDIVAFTSIEKDEYYSYKSGRS